MAYYTITYLIGIGTVCHIRALSDLFKMYMGGSLHSAIRVSLSLSLSVSLSLCARVCVCEI